MNDRCGEHRTRFYGEYSMHSISLQCYWSDVSILFEIIFPYCNSIFVLYHYHIVFSSLLFLLTLMSVLMLPVSVLVAGIHHTTHTTHNTRTHTV